MCHEIIIMILIYVATQGCMVDGALERMLLGGVIRIQSLLNEIQLTYIIQSALSLTDLIST